MERESWQQKLILEKKNLEECTNVKGSHKLQKITFLVGIITSLQLEY